MLIFSDCTFSLAIHRARTCGLVEWVLRFVVLRRVREETKLVTRAST